MSARLTERLAPRFYAETMKALKDMPLAHPQVAMADEDRYRDNPSKLDELRSDWAALFNEPMPWGFEVGEEQIPMLRQCIAERSKAPLEVYIQSLPAGRVY